MRKSGRRRRQDGGVRPRGCARFGSAVSAQPCSTIPREDSCDGRRNPHPRRPVSSSPGWSAGRAPPSAARWGSCSGGRCASRCRSRARRRCCTPSRTTRRSRGCPSRCRARCSAGPTSPPTPRSAAGCSRTSAGLPVGVHVEPGRHQPAAGRRQRQRGHLGLRRAAAARTSSASCRASAPSSPVSCCSASCSASRWPRRGQHVGPLPAWAARVGTDELRLRLRQLTAAMLVLVARRRSSARSPTTRAGPGSPGSPAPSPRRSCSRTSWRSTTRSSRRHSTSSTRCSGSRARCRTSSSSRRCRRPPSRSCSSPTCTWPPPIRWCASTPRTTG